MAEEKRNQIVQFNWRRHWSKKVAPHLRKRVVQAALGFGLRLLDPGWRRGEPPRMAGVVWGGAGVREGKLQWYQVPGGSHSIAFFAMAVGVLNYPHLHWRFVNGNFHTVPVGYGEDGEPRVVMDILLFDKLSAEESIALAEKRLPITADGPEVADAHAMKMWGDLAVAFKAFVKKMVPRIRAAALAGRTRR
jgi:hypothetical protein